MSVIGNLDPYIHSQNLYFDCSLAYFLVAK